MVSPALPQSFKAQTSFYCAFVFKELQMVKNVHREMITAKFSVQCHTGILAFLDYPLKNLNNRNGTENALQDL